MPRAKRQIAQPAEETPAALTRERGTIRRVKKACRFAFDRRHSARRESFLRWSGKRGKERGRQMAAAGGALHRAPATEELLLERQGAFRTTDRGGRDGHAGKWLSRGRRLIFTAPQPPIGADRRGAAETTNRPRQGNMNWYYEAAGQQQGPISDRELDRLLAEGKINPDTLVWREGLPAWAPLRSTRAASESAAPVPISAEPPSAAAAPPAAPRAVPAGYIRCTATGKYCPPSEIIYIEGRPYSAEAKPQVLQSLHSGQALPANAVHRNGPPWENRAGLSFLEATWQTIRGCLTEPGATFSRMRREGGIGAPFLFYLFGGGLSMILLLAIFMIFMMPLLAGLISSANSRTGGNAAPTFALTGGVGVMIAVVYGVLLLSSVAVAPFINAGVLHLSLKLVGGARQSFETTFRTWCYAHGSAMFVMLIPVCGWMAAGIWGLVATCIGLAKMHDISTGKATLAVLLPVIVCCTLQLGIQLVVGMAHGFGSGVSPGR